MERQRKVEHLFPELPVQEILQCMEDLRIPLSERDISKPNSAQVQKVFEQFAEIFMGINKDSYVQPQFGAMEFLEHPELHAESLSLITFYRIISKFMSQIGIKNFALRDMIRPTPQRLKIIYSGVINFAKFREDQLGIFEQFTQKTDDLNASKENLTGKKHQFSEKVKLLRMKRQQEQPKIQSVQAVISNLTLELKDLKKTQTGLSSEIEKMKNERSELSDKLSTEQFILMNLKQDCSKLKGRIVHSPETLLELISETGSAVQAEKANITSLERKARDLQLRSEQLDIFEQHLVKTIAEMESIDSALKKYQEFEWNLNQEKDNISKKETTIQELGVKHQFLDRQISNAQEKIQILEAQQLEKRKLTEKKLNELKSEYEAISAERDSIQTKIDANDKIVKSVESKISSLSQAHEDEMNSLSNDFNTLKLQVQTYCHEIRNQVFLKIK